MSFDPLAADPTQLDEVTDAACFPLVPHALHGPAWRRPWTIDSHTAQAPCCAWAFEVVQHIKLTPAVLGVQRVFTHLSIAPCTQVPNALRMADPVAHGLRHLAPGARCELSMSFATAVV